ncbi:MAG: PASTA domain-containing protein [Gemmatimonadota bacterium]|nr:PASTA domain-containing protein [Gemmatimonadota bacterium]
MNLRARLRRAFPYLVIGIGGFALAYVVIFIFVLPSKIVPAAPVPYVPDSSNVLRPIDPATVSAPTVVAEPSPVTAQLVRPPDDNTPIPAPDLVGMSLPEARGLLNSLRLRSNVTRDTSSFQPPNTVLSQQPAADSLISVDGVVRLTVSYFPTDTTVDTMRVQRGTTLPRIRSVPDSTRRDTLYMPLRDTLHMPLRDTTHAMLHDTLHPR